jgi:hypothetical protein
VILAELGGVILAELGSMGFAELGGGLAKLGGVASSKVRGLTIWAVKFGNLYFYCFFRLSFFWFVILLGEV